jgi:hypothetical protein
MLLFFFFPSFHARLVVVVFIFFFSLRHAMETGKLAGVPSCGLALLTSPRRTFDYVVRVSDGQQHVAIHAHRCVLVAHSRKLAALACDENFFDLDMVVKPGYLQAAIEVFQYMYLKDPTLLRDKGRALEMCGLLDMPLDHFLIANKRLARLNKYPTYTMVLGGGKNNNNNNDASVDVAGPFMTCLHAHVAKPSQVLVHDEAEPASAPQIPPPATEATHKKTTPHRRPRDPIEAVAQNTRSKKRRKEAKKTRGISKQK